MPLINQTFSQLITFTRASGATYFDASGVLQTAATNVPRFDYNPATLAARGLLIEEARTNSLLRSAEFDNASWAPIVTKNVTPNTDTAPDGTLTADTVSDSSAAAFQGIVQNVTVPADTTTYTHSIYVKKTTGGTSSTFGINLAISGGTSVVTAPRFNTDTGAVLNGTASVQNAGNYWRFVVSVTNNGSVGNTTLAVSLYPATAAYNSGSDTVTATGSVVVWGAQLEAGAFPTSYIPTTTTALTRSADLASVNTLSPWYNATAGTLYAEYIAANSAQNNVAISLSDGTNDNRMIIRATNSSAQTVFIGVASTVTQWNDVIITALLNTTTKSAFAYATNDIAWVRNGGTVGTDTTATIPTVNRLQLGLDGAGTFPLNGYLRRIVYYPRRLSNAELQSITS